MKRSFPLPVEAVTIDLDGTLVDSIPDLATASNMMLGELGRPPLPLKLIRTFVGKGIANLVDRALAGHIDGGADRALIARAMPIYERCYTQVNGKHTTIYPGVKEGLAALEAQGFPLACVTNKSVRFAQPLLEMLGLAKHFTQLVGGDTLAQKKPDPAPLIYAAERFGIAPSDMLMIGDSINDTQAARGAGCAVFCVTYGYNEGHDVRTLETDAIIDALPEAARLVRKA